MKPICLDLSRFETSESLVFEQSSIESLYHKHNQKIIILSRFPAVFKENPYVEKSYKHSSVDLDYFVQNYEMISSSRKNLLIITPHLSTGGAPQVTVNKIELIKNDFNIKVVEHDFLAWNYVVQRNRIMQLVGNENFITLGDNKDTELAAVIESFKPDVISMEEFPEMFMSTETANQVYKQDRYWTIIETTHDSSFNPFAKTCMPDKFVFVSPYSAFKYTHLDIPTEIIEYPVDVKERNQREMRDRLGLEHDYKHFVTVGLFTPRKNQAYSFELANHLKNHKIKFHFLGNQAGNFQSYWEPLMREKPNNCVVWGERDDVSDFLQASDVFFFPSKGDRGNKELNPIAIKEAMEYNDVIKAMYNLDVYCNKYNDAENIVYLTGDIGSDATNLIARLNLDVIDEECIILGTYPNLKERGRITKETITSLKPLGRKIILISHYPVDQETQKMVDYYIYDDYNPLTHHSYYTRFYNDHPEYYAEVNINGLKDTNQALTVLINMFTGAKLAKALGFNRFFYTTYDVVLHSDDVSNVNKAFKTDKRLCVATLPTPQGLGIQTNGMMFNTEFFLKEFDDVRTTDEYNAICERRGAQNYLEDYLSKVIFSFNPNDVEVITNPEQTLLINSGLGTSSNSEYYSIIPIVLKQNKYMFYFFTYNIDNRRVDVSIDDITFTIDIIKNREYKREFDYTGNNIISMKFYDGLDVYKTEMFEMNPSTIEKYQNTGRFEWKTKERPKIKLVHIQTTMNDDREIESRNSLNRVANHGWEYKLHINEPYKSLPPAYNCERPSCVSMTLFNEQEVQQYGTALTPGHYGCFEAFKNAILSEFHDCDFLMVCEGDCLIETEIEKFITVVESSCQTITNNNIGYMSFGDKALLEQGWVQSSIIKHVNDQLYITNKIIGLQCIMFPKCTASYLKEQLRTHKWDASDYFFNTIMNNSPWDMAIVHNRITTQADGFSLIDQTNKTFIKK